MTAPQEIIDVRLRCPGCGHVWLAAQIDPQAYWGTVKPEMIAEQVYCALCHREPPMTIASQEPKEPTNG